MNTPLKFNPGLQNLPVYQPGRPIEEVARELDIPPDAIIKLASNENPLGPSPKALAAMQRALRTTHLYPDGNCFYLKQRLAQKLELRPENLLLGNGSNEVLEIVGHALLEPGAEVVVAQYCFAVYPIVTHLFGARLLELPARDYGHDLPAMLKAVTPATRVMFVANPNNPTGTLAPPEEVVRLVEGIPDRVLLVIDEAYLEYLDQPLDLLRYLRERQKPNLLLVRTFSKIFGLAGLRIGYGIGAPEVVVALEKIREPFNINSLAQAGALAALDDDQHVSETRRINRQGLQFYETELPKLGLEFVPSAANFLLVRVGNGAQVFLEMQKLGVITRPMGGYRLPEWIRISVGTPAENQRCLEALRQVLTTTPPRTGGLSQQ